MIKETNEQQTAVIIEINELNYPYPGTEQPLWEKNLTFVLRKGEIGGTKWKWKEHVTSYVGELYSPEKGQLLRTDKCNRYIRQRYGMCDRQTLFFFRPFRA